MSRKFYIENNDNLITGQVISLAGDEFNHIINVSRKRVDDVLQMIDGNGSDITAQITSINKKDLSLKIVDIKPSVAETTNDVTVFQALVKGDKFELITQKLTELGVKKIVPFSSEFCQVKPNTTRLDRLEKISIEALKQCGRAKKVEIDSVNSFNQMLGNLSNYDLVLFAYENASENLSQKVFENLKKQPLSVALIIGSEGGFSQSEVSQILSQKNVKIVSMGKRILRAETASIALSSVVMFLLNEWRVWKKKKFVF